MSEEDEVPVPHSQEELPSAEEAPAASGEEATAEVFGARLDVYPLREAGDDPRWAVNTVKGWMWFDLFCLVFVLVMLVLGLFYD